MKKLIIFFFFPLLSIYQGCIITNIIMVNYEAEEIECDKDSVFDCLSSGFLPIDEAGFIGIEINDKPPFNIIKIFDGSYASALGINVGDNLYKVNDQEITSYNQAHKLLFGENNKLVNIAVKTSFGNIKSYQVRRKHLKEFSEDINAFYYSATTTYNNDRSTYVGPRGGVYHCSKSGKSIRK